LVEYCHCHTLEECSAVLAARSTDSGDCSGFGHNWEPGPSGLGDKDFDHKGPAHRVLDHKDFDHKEPDPSDSEESLDSGDNLEPEAS